MIETLTGNPGTYEWTVPAQKKNLKDCLVKVKALDVSGNKVAVSKSDATFTIAVLEVTSPNGGETLTSGDTHPIMWTTNEMKEEAAKVNVSLYSGGRLTEKSLKMCMSRSWQKVVLLGANNVFPRTLKPKPQTI